MVQFPGLTRDHIPKWQLDRVSLLVGITSVPNKLMHRERP